MAIPASGKSPLERVQQEHQRWFRWACAFRTGIEGRISVAKHRGAWYVHVVLSTAVASV